MPYFREQKILFIHIPKTGGTSLEYFLNNKFRNIEFKSLKRNFMNTGHSPQHLTYEELINLNLINEGENTIISIVRNPYHRIISELLFIKLIKLTSSKEDVEKCIRFFLNNSEIYDNHKIPQYNFLTFNGNMIDCILFRTENLTEQIRSTRIASFIFDDFDRRDNANSLNSSVYMELLTDTSIKMINDYYRIDFEKFGYEML